MVGFEKAFGAVKVIKDQIQYRSQSLLNLARGYFRSLSKNFDQLLNVLSAAEKKFYLIGITETIQQINKNLLQMSILMDIKFIFNHKIQMLVELLFMWIIK